MTRWSLRVSLNALLILALLEIAAYAAAVTAKKAGRRPPPPNLKPSSEILPMCRFSGAVNLTVSKKFVGTTWRGWGTSLAWFANYVGGLPQKNMNEMLDLLFAKDGLNFNIVRYNIGGGNNKKRSPQFYKQKHTDWRGMPGFKPTEEGPYDWSADQRQRNVLLGAKERGANVFEAFSNSPPWWMTKSGDVAGPPLIGQSNLKQEYESAFADYLTAVVGQFAKKWGVTFDSLEPFNEALEGFWQQGNENEGCSFDAPAMGRIIKYTSDSLKKKGLKTKLVGADSWSSSTAKLAQVANHQLLSRINVHSYMNDYGGSDVANTYEAQFGSVRETAKQLGKDVWVSEAGPLGKSGNDWDVSLYMARNVIETVNIMEASAYVYWQAYDLSTGWTLIDFPPNYKAGSNGAMKTPKPNQRFWIFKHFAMLAEPGSKPLKVGSDCSHGMSAFYSPGENRVTVFLLNQQAKERRVTINLQGFRRNVGGSTRVVVRRTSHVTNLGKKVFTRFGGKAAVTVWGQSFVSVTFTNLSD
ncbi:hypothetical protein CLOM_g3948 [Closterium sp. NIES-68]|nr:hypothetical protein CLOM_g3948 [Closterium sp. NIES-68]GJP85912.1 hypothetical protein CLOP_g16004 [Closterium sp. NIES-67]